MAIPIPNLPTDNLYKFMALSGLFVFVFFLTFSEIQVTKNTYLVSQTEAELSSNETLVGLAETVGDSDLSNELKLEFLKEVIEKNRIAKKQIGEAQINNNTNRSRLLPFFLISLIGGIVSINGFRLWHLRVQKPLDEILQLNLEKAKLEAVSSKE